MRAGKGARGGGQGSSEEHGRHSQSSRAHGESCNVQALGWGGRGKDSASSLPLPPPPKKTNPAPTPVYTYIPPPSACCRSSLLDGLPKNHACVQWCVTHLLLLLRGGAGRHGRALSASSRRRCARTLAGTRRGRWGAQAGEAGAHHPDTRPTAPALQVGLLLQHSSCAGSLTLESCLTAACHGAPPPPLPPAVGAGAARLRLRCWGLPR